MSAPKHTAGPWRWEINRKNKTVHLVGGVPKYDLTIMEPVRCGMGSAGFMFRDTAHDGFNIMHKLHEREDWVQPFPGRDHHAKWCANAIHPDARLIAAAPCLQSAAIEYLAATENSANPTDGDDVAAMLRFAAADKALRVAIAKSQGEKA